MSGRACLDDFGFTSVANFNCIETLASFSGGTNRWMAPELLGIKPSVRIPTPQTDLFALGMVAVEVVTSYH